MESKIEHILVRYPDGDRGFLIPILQEVQEFYGYISSDVVDEVARFTNGLFSLERAACFGCCALAPVVMVNKDVHRRISSVKSQKLLRRYNGK